EDMAITLSDKILSKHCLSLGNYEVSEYSKIGIFEIELNDKVKITRNRVALRNLIRDITKQVSAAMVVFIQGDKWRFSYISKRKSRNIETDEIQDIETAPKRYTYLFGKNERALTAAIRFDKLIQKQRENIFQLLSLADFEDAFSVEKLSRDFFREYKAIYEDFVQFLTGKRYIKTKGKFVETEIHAANFQLRNLFNNDEKQARDFCKRMMGRIIFLYFIQKKGWLAVSPGKKWGEGDPEYMFNLFANAKHKDDFYSQALVPLFFKTLNNIKSEDPSNKFRFPYLNGGLFDDAHDRRYNRLAMPTEIFERLFTTFNNYNFTVYEDAPDEHTVAVDPEMLGHIFENLLEDNKDKGAFYTPKEVVHFMCRESLAEYLVDHVAMDIDKDFKRHCIAKILTQEELQAEEERFVDKYAFDIIAALKRVTICDPAIGSGAFPMGLLQEIFNAEIYLIGREGFTRKDTEATIKKHIIEESIYGVDVDAGAVDIARLRFWLSLVVDEIEPQPLPNLSFKIVCANTLIPLGKIKNLDMAGTKEIADEMAKVRHDYFGASKEEKEELENRFNNLQKKLLVTAKDWISKEDAEVYQRLLEFHPFEEKSCNWFDPWWMFGVKGGFDVVIGNPPYLRIQGIREVDSDFADKLTKTYKSATGSFDLYGVFLEKSISLINSNGLVNFIMPVKWTNAAFGSGLREIISSKNSAHKIISFGAHQVFNASTYTALQWFKSDSECLIYHELDRSLESKEELGNYLDSIKMHPGTKIPNSLLKRDNWVLTTSKTADILKKLNTQPRRLSDVFEKIFQGLATSKDDVYFIYDCKQEGKYITGFSKEIDAVGKLEKEFTKPLLKGEDVHRYENITSDRVVIFPYKLNGESASLYTEKEIKELFPMAYSYLKKCEKVLRAREKGRFNIDGEWFQFGRKQGINFAEKEKLVAPEISLGGNFSYDEKGDFYSTT
uniref:Eco57I restriction-modification methylase domain-containing protein n=1 Tax=Aerococcus urinaeequi TaxID=51665 RepID=UPI00352AD3C6